MKNKILFRIFTKKKKIPKIEEKQKTPKISLIIGLSTPLLERILKFSITASTRKFKPFEG